MLLTESLLRLELVKLTHCRCAYLNLLLLKLRTLALLVVKPLTRTVLELLLQAKLKLLLTVKSRRA